MERLLALFLCDGIMAFSPVSLMDGESSIIFLTQKMNEGVMNDSKKAKQTAIKGKNLIFLQEIIE